MQYLIHKEWRMAYQRQLRYHIVHLNPYFDQNNISLCSLLQLDACFNILEHCKTNVFWGLIFCFVLIYNFVTHQNQMNTDFVFDCFKLSIIINGVRKTQHNWSTPVFQIWCNDFNITHCPRGLLSASCLQLSMKNSSGKLSHVSSRNLSRESCCSTLKIAFTSLRYVGYLGYPNYTQTVVDIPQDHQTFLDEFKDDMIEEVEEIEINIHPIVNVISCIDHF